MVFNTQRLIREAERPCSLESAVPTSFKKHRGASRGGCDAAPDKPNAPPALTFHDRRGRRARRARRARRGIHGGHQRSQSRCQH
jgi:hypothetical protein